MFVCVRAGDDLLEFHQAVVSTLRDADDGAMPLDPAPMSMLPPMQSNNPLLGHTNEDMARLSESHNEPSQDQLEDEADTGKRKRRVVFFLWCCLCVRHTAQGYSHTPQIYRALSLRCVRFVNVVCVSVRLCSTMLIYCELFLCENRRAMHIF